MGAPRTTVLGAGSWGTALAKVLADNGHEVRLWGRNGEHLAEIDKSGENARYLPGIPLPEGLIPTPDLDEALTDTTLIVLVVPTHAMRGLVERIAAQIPVGVPIVNASKGIENGTLELMSELLEDALPSRLHAQITHLSGPSFAREVAKGIPTAVCVAGRSHDWAEKVQQAFANQRLRVYTSDDVVGVEIGGALKNVIAIAAGAADGLGFGHNSRAALITRGLAEIGRLAAALGAQRLTLAGLAGMGDLVLTCTGDLSRNRHVGMELGKGRKLQDILDEMTMVAEGVRTARSAYELSRREGVEMPIVEAVYGVLYEGNDPREAVDELMARAPRPEQD